MATRRNMARAWISDDQGAIITITTSVGRSYKYEWNGNRYAWMADQKYPLSREINAVMEITLNHKPTAD